MVKKSKSNWNLGTVFLLVLLIVVIITLVLYTKPAKAEPVILFGTDPAVKQVQRKEILYLLYTRAACNLPIINKEHLKRFDLTFPQQAPQQGCWGSTLGGGVQLITPTGQVIRLPIQAFGFGVLKGDTVRIKQPPFASVKPQENP